MKVSGHTDEGFLYEILRPIRVAGFAGDEVDQPVTVPVVQADWFAANSSG